MKTRYLLERLERMPMLKVLAPFAAGIALAEHFTMPLWFLAGAFVCAGLVALLLRSSAGVVVLLLTAGFGVSQLHVRERTVPLDVGTVFEVRIESIPSDRGTYSAAEAYVTAWRNPLDASWHAAGDRVMLRADSLLTLNPGERVLCRGYIRPFRGPESYRDLMARRNFAGTMRLRERNILEQTPAIRNSLHVLATRRLERLGVDGDDGAVLRAMVTADRSGITHALRSDYSLSGFSHLLAVSGLHTGIVFVLINALLWWLPLLRHGHRIRNLIAATAIWLFVAAAGFPPSAVRAAVMCTMLQFALASASEYNALNTLSTAAFGMLLWNPAWIGDISFQLSFLAVAGILAWGVPLCRRLRTRYRAVNAITNALAISLVATAATLPLVSNTFGTLPLAGIALNPIAILLGTLVVFAGVVWLIVPLPFLAPLLGFVAQHAAEAQNALARFTASIPGATPGHTLDTGPMLIIYLFFVVATLGAWSAEPKKSVHLPT